MQLAPLEPTDPERLAAVIERLDARVKVLEHEVLTIAGCLAAVTVSVADLALAWLPPGHPARIRAADARDDAAQVLAEIQAAH